MKLNKKAIEKNMSPQGGSLRSIIIDKPLARPSEREKQDRNYTHQEHEVTPLQMLHI